MRHIIYFSSKAVTSGGALRKKDLMEAGRIDIAIHSIIQGLYLSHDIRKDTVIHLVFYGMPDPPKHIEIHGSKVKIAKKNIAKLLQKILYKYKEGERKEVLPGCFVEKKSLLNIVDEFLEKNSQVFVLDENGKSIRDVDIENSKDVVFVLGDQEGLPKKELRRMKKTIQPVSVGNKTYFASQTIVIVNNELDFRNI
ncbi:hypothetical protein GF378_03000 [Candidatus Pacearchaeota archaeon]|nr:hypothetical protein [Candidatus Pacearchaeota archaeon]